MDLSGWYLFVLFFVIMADHVTVPHLNFLNDFQPIACEV